MTDCTLFDHLHADLRARLRELRTRAGYSHAELAALIGCQRTTVSQLEGTTREQRVGSKQFWQAADRLLSGGDGSLLDAYHGVIAARRQARQAERRAQRIAQATARTPPARQPLPAPDPRPAPETTPGTEAAPGTDTARGPQAGPEARAQAMPGQRPGGGGPGVLALVQEQSPQGLACVPGELTDSFLKVMMTMARLNRRNFTQIIGGLYALVTMANAAGIDYESVAGAVSCGRVTEQVIYDIHAMVRCLKRQEDALGPSAVIKTAKAQHELVRGLRAGCPDRLQRGVATLDASLGLMIGGYLVDLGQRDEAMNYFRTAQRAGHAAGNAACACYALCSSSHVAFLAGDAAAAMGSARAARERGARLRDPQLRALAEQMTGAAHAIAGEYDESMAACSRALDILATGNRLPGDQSLAYWFTEAAWNSTLGHYLLLLGCAEQAAEVTRAGRADFGARYVCAMTRCDLRLATALGQLGDIRATAELLTRVAPIVARQGPSTRLIEDFRRACSYVRGRQHLPVVRQLDATLSAHGLLVMRRS